MLGKKLSLVLCMTLVLGVMGCSRQQSDWEKTRTSNSTDAYELFLKKYPSGEFTAQAQARLKELYEEHEWQKARDTDTVDAYQTFLKQYPEGKWSEEARIRVENFTLASAPGAGAPGHADASSAPEAPVASSPTSVAPVAKPAVSDVAASTGAYGVQLGAFKSGSTAATERWAHLQKNYPRALAGLTPKVTPGKSGVGTLYRLQVAHLSATRATAICATLKAHSEACVLLHPGHIA